MLEYDQAPPVGALRGQFNIAISHGSAVSRTETAATRVNHRRDREVNVISRHRIFSVRLGVQV